MPDYQIVALDALASARPATGATPEDAAHALALNGLGGRDLVGKTLYVIDATAIVAVKVDAEVTRTITASRVEV